MANEMITMTERAAEVRSVLDTINVDPFLKRVDGIDDKLDVVISAHPEGDISIIWLVGYAVACGLCDINPDVAKKNLCDLTKEDAMEMVNTLNGVLMEIGMEPIPFDEPMEEQDNTEEE